MRLSDPTCVLGLVVERFDCQEWVLCGSAGTTGWFLEWPTALSAAAERQRWAQ
jgi:hypothetical protein